MHFLYLSVYVYMKYKKKMVWNLLWKNSNDKIYQSDVICFEMKGYVYVWERKKWRMEYIFQIIRKIQALFQ